MSNLVGLVTGAASGLGKATAIKLLQSGMRLITLDKNFSEDNYENCVNFTANQNSDIFIEDMKNNCIFVKGDILSENDIQNGINAAIEKWNKLNVVVNCAGVSNSMLIFNRQKDFPIDMKAVEDTININVCGTFNVIRLASRAITKNKINNSNDNVIINVAGLDYLKSPIRNSVIAASSGAIASMTLPISRDLSSLGIRVVTISPGYFETPMLRANSDFMVEFLGGCNIFPNRLGDPDEFASCVKNVIENKMLNGEVIQLDAGCSLPSFDFN